MSTFRGFMPEFPHIRVDFFREIEFVPPPLACFLSHIHSDHLAGLESLRAPFVYCSAATKALLLRLERYPHRINFERGILESRKQHYRHLKNLLKPIPLHTPTRIELAPGNDIQITLFDANHCIGAVMFLIEGGNRAVLYTGDIRAEPWFVNALTRNPLLIEYSSHLKTLNCIYLDTSFIEDISFPTKAEGLKELLEKVSKYPPTTEFYFNAWTFGYEEVWMTLSRSLKSQIHVDNYKMSLYQSLHGLNGGERLSGFYLAREAPTLTGFRVGNTDHPGILTLDPTVRLHSCEKGVRCGHLGGDDTVWIRPIVTRLSSGEEICEMGMNGSGDGLTQPLEVELESDAMIQKLMALFANQKDSSILCDMRHLLLASLQSSRKVLVLDDAYPDYDEAKFCNTGNAAPTQGEGIRFPKIITFPYSRHSSYAELLNFVKAFKPMDVYPCTVNKRDWHEGVSVKALFGNACSGHSFRYDQETLLDINKNDTRKSQNTSSMHGSQTNSENGGDFQSNISGSGDKPLLKRQRTAADLMELPPGSDPQGLCQGMNLEDCDKSSRKYPRLRAGHADIRPQSCGLDSEMRGSEDTSKPTAQTVPRVSHCGIQDGVHHREASCCESWRLSGEYTGYGVIEPASYETIDYTDNEGSTEYVNARAESEKCDCYSRIYHSPNAVEDERRGYTKSGEHVGSTGRRFCSISARNYTSGIERGYTEDTGHLSDEEMNFKPLNGQVSSTHNMLVQEHDEHIYNEELRQDVPGSDYYDSDECRLSVEDVQAEDSSISAAILSHILCNSQSSVISTRRLRSRVDAFLAAAKDWHSISLMSTGDNHTEEELEL